ncbi:MAG: nitroreductase family protein [Ruminococcaceae bacterium]|nr:nitroreductase family protein [Oscillospiraceae bacterium]
MQTKECIRKRRSIRGYTDEPIEYSVIEKLVEDATLAPSGMNRQPWKFLIVSDKNKIEKISELSESQGNWIKTSKYLLFVFLDKSASYNSERDLMSIGASIENFMLSACDEGIGTCWLGGILSYTDEILNIIGYGDDNLSLKAIITLGKFEDKEIVPNRKPFADVLIKI